MINGDKSECAKIFRQNDAEKSGHTWCIGVFQDDVMAEKIKQSPQSELISVYLWMNRVDRKNTDRQIGQVVRNMTDTAIV